MNREIWRHFDYWLFGTVVVLCIFGIVMIQSAIAGNEVLQGYVQRQAIFVLIGLAVIIGMAIVDYRFWAPLTSIMYLVVFVFLVVIFAMGKTSFGSARWIDTGLFLIQPSELAKIVIILVLADYFAKNKDKPRDLSWILGSIWLTGGLVIFVILQPDLSTSIVILVIWFSLIWMSGLKTKHLVIFGLVGLIGGIIYFFTLMGRLSKSPHHPVFISGPLRPVMEIRIMLIRL